MLIAQDSTAIAAQSGATLSTSTELAEAIVKSTNFSVKNSGDQDWTLSHEGQIEDDAGKHALTNGNAELRVKVDATDDSTDNPALETVPGLQSITLSMEQELNETPPGIDQPTGWTYYTPLRRDWTLEIEGHYYDPADELIYQGLHDAIDAGGKLDAELDLFGLTFTGAIANDSREIEAGTDDNAAYSFSFGGSDTLSKSGSIESTISSLLDLYFNQASATVALQHRENESVVTGSTAWTGDAYISSLEIELARNAYPQISGEFQGDGSLSRNTQ
jgi:hypothetical protein